MEIWLVNTTNFSARVIHTGMKLFCALRGKEKPSIVYNHALIYDPSSDCIYEADFPKVVRITKSEWLAKKKNKTANIKVVGLKLTERQQRSMLSYLTVQVGKPYETINFWWHLVKIFTGKWNGDRTDKAHYCYELVIRAVNSVCVHQMDDYLNPYEFWMTTMKPSSIYRSSK